MPGLLEESIEAKLWQEINDVRQNPAAYAEKLVALLDLFEGQSSSILRIAILAELCVSHGTAYAASVSK